VDEFAGFDNRVVYEFRISAPGFFGRVDNRAVTLASRRQHADPGEPVNTATDHLALQTDIVREGLNAHRAFFKPPDRGGTQDDGVEHGAAQFAFHPEDRGDAAEEVTAFVF
jgi:hypothetical protein